MIRARDAIPVFFLSVVFFIIASLNLGLNEIPSSGWQISGSDRIYFDLKRQYQVSELALMVKKGEFNLQIFIGHPDSWEKIVEVSVEGYNQWRRIGVHRPTQYLKIDFDRSGGEILEMLVLENNIRIESLSIWGEDDDQGYLNALIDEQDLASFPPTYMSESVFDEVYFVRAAKDYISRREPFEDTHPPLGKLIIAGGILIFGDNPFGWRIVGTLFATAMLPVIFLFGKEVSGSWISGFFSTILLFFDFMHFTMGRIATTDIFLVFFILASQLFFYKYVSNVLEEGWGASIHPFFVATILSALGFSTKWTAAFNFAAQLFILGLIRYGYILNDKGPNLSRAINRNTFFVLAGTATVFILIYFMTYIPYMSLGHSLKDIYERQWSMLSYHTGLTASHYFASPWWSWPLNSKPVWLYVSYLEKGWVSTISAFGNPIIWWAGFIMIIIVFERAIRIRNLKSVFLATMFTFQWLPFALLSRPLFIYHYFSNVPLLCLSISNQICVSFDNKKSVKIGLFYLIVVAIAFGLFYPIISGSPIPNWWREMLMWFGSWRF